MTLTPDGGDAAVPVVGFDTSIRYAPDRLVSAHTDHDVELAVRRAAEEGLPLTVVNTGHGTPTDVTGGLLLSTHEMASVEVDVEQLTARVAAGATWAQVITAAVPHGLAPLCGSAPGVGVVGYLLGGGLGPLARTYGYSADHVRSVEVVTPLRGAVTATPTENAELFWALCGGKWGLGVVTAVTIDLVPLTHVYGGGLFFPAEAARDVLGAVTEWAPRLPTDSTASVALLRLPPLPQVPEPLRGRFVVHVRFASTAAPEDAAARVAAIRALGTPLVDTLDSLPYARIGEVHGDPTDPLPVMCGALALSGADDSTVDALLEVAGPQHDLSVAAVELRCLGGALAQETGVPNAVGGREAAWGLFATAAPVPGLDPAVKRVHVRSVLECAGARRAPVNLVNFVGRANEPAEVRACWSSAQQARLDAVRTVEDPDSILTPKEHTL